MTIKTAVLAALVSMVFASGVQAATTHVFDLSKHGPQGENVSDNSFSLTVAPESGEGEALTATFAGLSMDSLVVGADGTILDGNFVPADEGERHNNGMGVCRVSTCPTSYSASNPTAEPHTVDGVTDGIFDYIEMSFTSAGTPVDVTLSSLTFGWIGEWKIGTTDMGYPDSTGAFEIVRDTSDEGDNAGIGIFDQIVLSETVAPTYARTSRGTVDLTIFDVSLFDQVFGIKAGNNGSWKLLSVTVDFDPTLPPPEIPLPAAGWLLIGGLGGLAWFGRRRR